jgi:shikimate kinase
MEVKNNIALIGMMGSGKSVIGEALAQKLGMFFLDTDKLIEFDRAMTIEEIFNLHGEDFFRHEEREIIHHIKSYENVVIATGGGVVLSEANIINLKKNCLIIFLSVDESIIFKRLKGDNTRPLFKDKSLEKLKETLAIRMPLYEKYSDFKVKIGAGSIEQSVETVIEAIGKFYNLQKQKI